MTEWVLLGILNTHPQGKSWGFKPFKNVEDSEYVDGTLFETTSNMNPLSN